jgi:hypothetical protein
MPEHRPVDRAHRGAGNVLAEYVTEMATQKSHCYVDETGQDTKGALFLVAVVVVERERSTVIDFLEAVERETAKGTVKWRKARRDARVAYLRRAFAAAPLRGRLFYRAVRGTAAYREQTLITIARAVAAVRSAPQYKAPVFIDGLPRADVRAVVVGLRKRGVATEKVRGLRDEVSALVRLDDAVAGVARDQLEGDTTAAELLRPGRAA